MKAIWNGITIATVKQDFGNYVAFWHDVEVID